MNLGIWELLLILGIVVLVFGTKKLRNVGGDLGGALKNFKDAMRQGEQDESQKMANPPAAPKTPIDVQANVAPDAAATVQTENQPKH